MKKILSSTLALFTLASLTACGGQATMTPGVTQPQMAANAYQPNFQAPMNQMAAPQQGVAPQAPMTYAAAPTQQGAKAPVVPGSRPTPNFNTGTAAKPASAAPRAAAAASAPRAQAAAPRAAAPAAPTSDSVGRELIAKARARFDSVKNFIVLGDAYEKDEKGETRIKLKLAFQKGSTCRLDIVQHTNSMFSGAKLMYTPGTDSVTGRPGGAMSFMKMTLPMSDNKIQTRRGYRLDQVDTNAISTRLLGNPALNPKILGKTTVNGRQIAVLEFTNVNDFDQRITRELLGIDMEDHFVRIHEMYAGNDLVYSLKLTQVTLDGPITAADLSV
jgi:hypothetical protein